MKRFHNILVVAPAGADGSEALQAAVRLASVSGASVTLFDAVAPIPPRRGGRIGQHTAEYLQGLIEDARRAELEQLAATASVPVTVALSAGALFIETIHLVTRFGYDLVVTTPDQPLESHGLSRASTTMHLLRKCPVPVWVQRPDVAAGNDVLAAVGPFPEGEPTALDRTILSLGASLASWHGGRLHVVHAWALEGESLLRRGRVHLPAAEVDDMVKEEQMIAQLAVEKLLIDTGVYANDVGLHLENGSPAAVIPEIARQLSPGVVVLGTLARTGIAGLLIGNTAETILGAVDADVLAVKPDGFVSPIQWD
jgi:nucleotide-binding universal stress UspA family protein